jgi:hypothetical protein
MSTEDGRPWFTGRWPVRAMGSGKVHIAKLDDVDVYELKQFGVVYNGSPVPVDSLCGTRVGAYHGWVVMQGGAIVVGCTGCRRLNRNKSIQEWEPSKDE